MPSNSLVTGHSSPSAMRPIVMSERFCSPLSTRARKKGFSCIRPAASSRERPDSRRIAFTRSPTATKKGFATAAEYAPSRWSCKRSLGPGAGAVRPPS